MFAVEQRAEPDSPTLLRICQRYGALVDPDNETEEGIYLLMFFSATLNTKLSPDDFQRKEFNARLKAYVEKFPESTMLRAVHIGEDIDGEELLRRVREATGMTPEKQAWYERQLTLMQSGDLAVPFSLRPHLLPQVSNILDLWETCKRVGRNEKQYNLTLSQGVYRLQSLERWVTKPLLLDDISILVLFDLDLLETVFDIVPAVAISKASILNFQNLAQGPFVSTWHVKARRITDLLTRFIKRIEQPAAWTRTASRSILGSSPDELREILERRPYVLYSDDAICRAYIGRDHEIDAITIIDILELLRSRRMRTQLAVAKSYAQLCRWNVGGVRVEYRDMLVVLQPDFRGEESVSDAALKLERNVDYQAFSEGIWNNDREYTDVIASIADFLTVMLAQRDGIRVEMNVIVAIWCSWYQKVQFRLKGEKDKLSYLSRSCCAVAFRLSGQIAEVLEQSERAAQLWSAYKDVVKRVHGASMDENVEQELYASLAEYTAELGTGRSGEVYAFLSSGLVSGTSESDLFAQLYSGKVVQGSSRGGGLRA